VAKRVPDHYRKKCALRCTVADHYRFGKYNLTKRALYQSLELFHLSCMQVWPKCSVRRIRCGISRPQINYGHRWRLTP